MKLHHGTNIDFGEIQLSKCLPYKDFGRGFYLTPSKRRARLRALDKIDKEHYGVPVIISYDFDEAELDNMKVLRFDTCTEQWLDFILKNRNRKTYKPHDYDVVIAPVADDGVINSISLYESKVINRSELLKRIEGKKGYIQYSFCTQKAIDKLQRI